MNRKVQLLCPSLTRFAVGTGGISPPEMVSRTDTPDLLSIQCRAGGRKKVDGSKIECNTFTEGFVADAKDCIHGDRLQGAEFQIHSRANILLCAAHAKKTCRKHRSRPLHLQIGPERS